MTLTFSRYLQVKTQQSPLVVDVRRALLNTSLEPQTPQDVLDALHAYRSAMHCSARRYHSDDDVVDLWRSYQRSLRASEAA